MDKIRLDVHYSEISTLCDVSTSMVRKWKSDHTIKSSKLSVDKVDELADLFLTKYHAIENIKDESGNKSIFEFTIFNNLKAIIERLTISKENSNFKKEALLKIESTDRLLHNLITSSFINETTYSVDISKTLFLYKSTKDNTPTYKPTRLVLFDFDGTLISKKSEQNVWELLYIYSCTKGLQGNVDDALLSKHKEYASKEIHQYFQSYYDNTITHHDLFSHLLESYSHFDFSSHDLEDFISSLDVIEGINDLFTYLHKNHIKIYILSGAVLDIIRKVLEKELWMISDVIGNELQFDKNGIIENILETKYDSKYKANFITKLSRVTGISPIEMVYFGDSLNDEKVTLTGVKTVLVNPKSNTTPSLWDENTGLITDLNQLIEYIEY